MITLNARNHFCKCGRRGEFLNINSVFGADKGNAVCGKCRDKYLKEKETKNKKL